MDHLPHPQDAAFPPVTVPYYDKYKYDGGSFTDYPIRCGFDKREFIWADFTTVPSNDHNSFFQAWLFFGLLHEFFGAISGASLDEFIDHEAKRVTTARLPYWAAKWQQSQPIFAHSKERIAKFERLNKCLREVRDTIAYLDNRERRQQGWSHLSEEVGLSISVLGLSLEEIKDYRNSWSPSGGIKDQDRLSMLVGSWPTSEFARKRLEAAGWCKSEVARLETYMFSTGMVYCGSMQSYGRSIDHSRCSEDRCAAEDINEETYTTAHAEGCQGCEHDGPKSSDLASVLIGKSFPVIELRKSERTPAVRISVVPHRKSMAYTAISHVWADGLGNPRGNTLPQCQIRRLYHLLQSHNSTREGRTSTRLAFISSKTNTVYLWIDTLCIPLEKKLRKKAISLMYNVYNEAKTVLLLDRSLLSISTERPTEELLFRITASPWMRRAWTLQEGAVAKSLYVQFADRAILARTAMESQFKRTKGAKSYNITLLESCRAIVVVESSGGKHDPDQIFSDVHTSLRHRSTSHPEDKEICFAIMIRCDMDRIMEAEGDFRTQRVYQQLKSIPRTFLWHVGPKLDIPGFRWAPKDIFSVACDAQYGLSLSDRGLLVGAHGMVYFGRSHYMSKWALYIRDFINGKWYNLRWRAGESFDGAVVPSNTPWTTLAVILQPKILSSPIQNGVVIRLDWDPSMATPQELSNYISRSETISGEYMGTAQLEEVDQIFSDQMEQRKVFFDKTIGDIAEVIHKGQDRLENYPQHQRQIIEEGDNSWFMFEGEMRGSEQKWCVT